MPNRIILDQQSTQLGNEVATASPAEISDRELRVIQFAPALPSTDGREQAFADAADFIRGMQLEAAAVLGVAAIGMAVMAPLKAGNKAARFLGQQFISHTPF